MKKVLTLLMAMLMMTGAAFAESTGLEAYTVTEDTVLKMDLDADGELETLDWQREPIGEYDECAVVTITDGSDTFEYRTDVLYQSAVYVTDMDADGRAEIFISGDMMSDDYVTVALRYCGGLFQQLQFEDGWRGENTDDTLEYGYGEVTAIDGNSVELTGSQDMLGTYFCVRTMSLVDNVFEFVDDGLWCVCGVDDPEMWEYRALRPLKPIPATFVDEDGMETAGEIAEGEAFMVTASDKTTLLWFITEDGRTGYFGIEPNEEQGWGYLVEGMSEDELFEMVPYAD